MSRASGATAACVTDDPDQGVLCAPTRLLDYLVGRKTRGDQPGVITCPGGWLKLGERPFDAALREYAEETGLHRDTIAEVVKLGVLHDDHFTTHLYIGTFMGLRYRTSTLTDDQGICDWRWMHEDALIQMPPESINSNFQLLVTAQKTSRERRLRNGVRSQ